MKNLLAFFLQMIIAMSFYAQGLSNVKEFQRKLDSLQRGQEKIQLIDSFLAKNEYSKALLKYAQMELELSEELKSEKLISKSYYNLAKIHYNAQEYNLCIPYYKKYELSSKFIADDTLSVNAYYEISSAYFYNEQHDLSIYELRKAVPIVLKLSDLYRLSQIYRAIGRGYLNLSEMDSAYVYLKKSLDISISDDSLHKNTIFTLSAIGKYYFIKEEYRKSLEYQFKALEILGNYPYPQAKALIFYRIADTYYQLNKLDSALVYCRYLNSKNKNNRIYNSVKFITGKIYYKKNQLDAALAYLDSAYINSRKIENINLIDKILGIYAKIYAKKGDLKKTIYYKDARLDFYEKMIKRLNKQKIKNINILMDIDKFRTKNDQLLEQKKKNEMKLEESKKLNFAFALIIILGALVVLVTLYSLKKIKDKQLVIEKQNSEIHEKNIELHENNLALQETLVKLQKTQEQLIHSEKMASLGMLSAGIAHEINNPINFVYAGINSLSRDFNDIKPVVSAIKEVDPESKNLKEEIKNIEKIKEENFFDEAFDAIPQIISDIRIGADRTAEIVRGLRYFSRTDKEEMQSVNIHEGIETSLLLLKNKYKKSIEIIKNYDSALPELKCYPGKMNQVFLNILSNAIDSIEGKGSIIITTKSENGNILISIKDSGSGMTEETKSKLFDPFFTTKPVGKGIGLGLSITYSIIKEHNGEIKVLSKIGKGTEMIIILPLT